MIREFKINNIHCEGCINRIKNCLSKIEGIKDFSLTLEDKMLKIDASDEVITKVLEKLQDLDFTYEEITTE